MNAVKVLAKRLGLVVRRRKSYPPGVDLLIDLERLFGDERLVAYDIGAHVGEFTCRLKRAFPNSLVTCFEPVPATFDALRNRLAKARDVQCHRLAISDRTGRLNMTAVPFSSENAVVSGSACGEAVLGVDAMRLDDFLAENHETFIHILKIDTEGHDMAVLRGGEKTLLSGRIGVVQVEVTFSTANTLHCQFSNVAKYLEKLGFRFGGVTSTWCLQDRPARMAWCDVMFVLEDVLRKSAGESGLWAV